MTSDDAVTYLRKVCSSNPKISNIDVKVCDKECLVSWSVGLWTEYMERFPFDHTFDALNKVFEEIRDITFS